VEIAFSSHTGGHMTHQRSLFMVPALVAVLVNAGLRAVSATR
jgi:hypothetical protein